MTKKLKDISKVFSLALVAFSLAAASPAAAEVIKVDVNKMLFSPSKITAHIGDTIEWTNSDFVDHTATDKNGKWEVMLPVKGKGTTILKEAGKIEYYCKYHPNMKGQIAVIK